MKQFIYQILAVIEKELRLQLRWGKDFLLRVVVSPLFYLIPYFLLYQGLFNAGAGGLGDLTAENYPVWLFLGTIYYTFIYNGFNTFEIRFLQEKYWMTIQALFLTPIHKYAYLIGIALETLMESFVILLVFSILSYFIIPTFFLNILGIVLILLIALVASAGIGLLRGGIVLINENFRQIIYYALFFILFFSCYSLPLSLLPASLQIFATMNPFYHGLLLIRSIWLNTIDSTFLFSLIYLIVFSVITLIVAVWLFNKLTKRFGIHGY